jgi:hypothetical protein
MRLSLVLGVAFLLAFSFAPIVHADDSWVGKTIFPKEPGIKFGQANPKSGDVFFGTLDEMKYKVLADQNNLLLVRQNGKEGWFSKSDAMLIENAVDFFSRREQHRDKACHDPGPVWRLVSGWHSSGLCRGRRV